MASETDFLDMYRTLGLRPGCDLLDLKQAYRRHVARLHPDRKGGLPPDPVAAARLQRLIAQYDSAMAFQREHGRLPGATPRVRFAVPEANVHAARGTPPPTQATRTTWRRPMLLLLPAIVLAAMGWDIATRPQAPATSSAPTTATDDAQPLGSSATSAAPTLALGMTPEEVRAIEGDPINVRGDRWEYGPSWIRFEDDHVVDWYSSPLHSLGANTRSPDATHP